MTQAQKAKVVQTFTAVDLVTIAVFAVIYRAFWYVWHAVGFLFPFNQMINTFILALGLVAVAVIVRKPGAGFFYYLVATIVNFLLQGEPLVGGVIVFTALVPEVYWVLRLMAGGDPFGSLLDQLIGAFLLSLPWNLLLYYFLFPAVYLATIPPNIALAAWIAGTIAGTFGGLVGFYLGERLKGLIG